MKNFKKNVVLFYSLSITLLILCFAFFGVSLTLYLIKYKTESEHIYLAASIVFLLISLLLIIVIRLRRSRKDTNFFKLNSPIIKAIGTYLFYYDCQSDQVTISKDLAKFFGTNKTSLSMKEVNEVFIDGNFAEITYDNLVNNHQVSFKYQAKNGKYVSLTYFASSKENKKYIVGYVTDYTLEFIEEQSLLKAARIDTLTETYRRSYFVKKVKEHMINMDDKGALVFVDVDNFKSINDKYGHSYGDIVLMKIGAVLKNYFQNKKAIIARSGGDEFLIYLHEISSYSEVSALLNGLISAIKSISISEINLKQVYISMGVSLFPLHSNNYETLFKYADDSLYQAKNVVGSAFSIYDQDKVFSELNIVEDEVKTNKIDNDIFANLTLDEVRATLEASLAKHEFKIYIQPEIAVNGKHVDGECLCRWETEDNGLLYPSQFMAYFERTGLLYPFDLYIFEECLKISKEVKADKNIKPMQLALNQSIKTIIDPNYQNDIIKLVEKYDYKKGSLAVEITERAVFSGMRHIMKAIEVFHGLGLNVIIDDFGSGYTSLAIIKDVDIDEIKIDRSFLKNPSKDTSRCLEIISSIASLSKKIKTLTILEGIETVDDFLLGKNSKVDYVQGYLFEYPIPYKEFLEKVKNNVYLEDIVRINKETEELTKK